MKNPLIQDLFFEGKKLTKESKKELLPKMIKKVIALPKETNKHKFVLAKSKYCDCYLDAKAERHLCKKHGDLFFGKLTNAEVKFFEVETV